MCLSMMQSPLVWLLVIFVHSTAGKSYLVPTDWAFDTVSGDFKDSSSPWADHDHLSYAFLSNGSSQILSDNGRFALAVQNSSNIITRGIAVMLRNGVKAVPIWRRVSYGNSISTYMDVDSLSKVELNDTGNLGLYSSNGSLMWQSFEDPAEVMLPGQRLHTGMTLSTYYTFYVNLEVLKGGLAMKVKVGYSGTPYQVWSLYGNSTLQSAAESVCYGYKVVLEYSGAELLLKYEQVLFPTPSVCTVPTLRLPLNGSSPEELPFLRLEEDGDLVAYRYDVQKQGWIKHWKLSDTWPVKLYAPLECGPYGIRDGTGNCICSLSYHGYSEERLRHPWNYPCQVGSYYLNLECSASRDLHQENGTGYFGTRFREPDVTDESEEKCKTMCIKMRCHCWAFFYNRPKRQCFFFREPLAGSLHRDSNMTAYLKVYQYQAMPLIGEVITSFGLLFLVPLVPFVLLLAIVGLAICNCRLRYNEGAEVEAEVEALLATMQGLPHRYTYTALDTATKGFATKLGSGGFGSVYEGVTTDGKHVAVKKLDDNGSQGAKQFVTEVAGIGGISHVNIVKLCGFCIEGATQKLLVYEFMANGSLDTWLFGSASSQTSLTWQQRIEIALGTARGLLYLHEECSEPILHLDVKPQNILLDENFVAKVADFGMAKLLENRHVTRVQTAAKGTTGYIAPEWMFQNYATKKCDVFSYGMVLLELIGGRRNIEISRLNAHDELWYFPSWVADQVKKNQPLQVVDEKVRDAASENQAGEQMVYLALWCIQKNPSLRPSMRTVVEILEGNAAVEEPPLAFHFDSQTDSITEPTDVVVASRPQSTFYSRLTRTLQKCSSCSTR